MARMADETDDLTGRTVLAVFAHPDDESLACGGTLARLADAGARVVLLCASRGEGGSISDPALVPDGDLGRVREHELREAARVLGIAEVLVLDHPDGELRWVHVHELHVEIVSTIRACRPDAVTEFGETQCLRGGLGQFEAKYLMTQAMAHAGRLGKYGA